jgi:hypothetical protein
LNIDDHCVVDAVSGMVCNPSTPGLKVSVPLLVVIPNVRPDEVVVAKVNVVVATPLIVVVAKYPLRVFPAHDRYEPSDIREDGVV